MSALNVQRMPTKTGTNKTIIIDGDLKIIQVHTQLFGLAFVNVWITWKWMDYIKVFADTWWLFVYFWFSFILRQMCSLA